RERAGGLRAGRRLGHREQQPRPDDGVGVLGGLDAAQRRRAVHPHLLDPADAARQHRSPGRRHHGAARPRQHPGLDRRPDALQPAARLPADAARTPAPEPRGVRGRRRRQGRVLGQQAVLHGQPAQELVGRARDRRERLRLRLPAQDRRRPQLVPDDRRDDPRRGLGLFPRRREPGRRAPQQPDEPVRAGQPRLAGRARPADDRVGDLLEGGPGARDGGAVPGLDRHRGLLHAGRHPRGEGRHLHPDAARPAVAGEGRRAAGRRPQRPVVLLPPRAHPARAARGLDRSAGPSPARAHLGLPDARGDGRPERGRGSPRDQRLRSGRPAHLLPADEGRRLDDGRLLDLLRRLRRRGEPGRAPQAREGAGRRRLRVGLGVAAQPADALQPRLGRPRRQAVERAQEVRLVGRGRRRVDRSRRPRFREDQAPGLRAAGGGEGAGRAGRERPVRHAGRRQGVAVRAGGRRRRPVADALRAGRVGGRERALQATGEPDPRDDRGALEPQEPEPQRRLPVPGDHLPADRAPHGRGDEPHAALPGGAAAGVLRRGEPRARAHAGPDEQRVRDVGEHADRGGGEGAGDREGAADQAARRHGRAPDRDAVPLVLRRHLDRGRRQRPAGHRDGPEHPHPGVEGVLLRHRAGSAAARAGAPRVRRGLPPPGRRGLRPGGRQRPGSGRRRGRGGIDPL
ncbi:MAG: Formate dehydrogenase O alpha subunit, partial [uncultured Blastococcus sp.]